MWYREHIGRERCPIVDTWWQTETGMILITTLPGLDAMKPSYAGRPFPGIDADILDDEGRSIQAQGGGGYLAITKPWPAMLRGIWRDPERYQEQYWKKWKHGAYFTSDGAKQDSEGYFCLLGRVDDVLNVSGHRISTMEVESALVDHKSVAEAAVVGVADEIKGEVPAAFVTLRREQTAGPELERELKQHVVNKIGAIARPHQVVFAGELPKTRSGKIMRRLLRDIAVGRVLGDTTTLADTSVVEALKKQYEEGGQGA